MSAEGWSFFPLTATYGAGIVLVVFWWDRHNPFVLAEDLSEAMDRDALGSQSFGAFHEVRARSGGRTMTLAVHATRRQIQDALRLAGLPAPAG